MSYRAQFAVRKRGTSAPGRWSTRILTIDTETATVTISRHNHPSNVLYHSLKVKVAQMWPRFKPTELDDDYESLDAKMTLRIIGAEVLVPIFIEDDDDVASGTPSSSQPTTKKAAAPHGDGAVPNIEKFAFTAGDSSKKSRPLRGDAIDGLYEVWLIRFTSIESYEAAVALLQRLRSEDGGVRNVCGDHVAGDLAAVRRALAVRFATNAAVAKQALIKASSA
ncbi:hypothetical protein ABB37_09126 [Leptomonas pyrrhocoris]|uniref:Uncharacterized protein n=1 Tax=Leptomonas pyrrhocoris TaxID=157538 RepID=A0A0N0DRG7_LEPPY|nr:hypothetical protein ABB37_09126 [Leptomonas pyrrhocoris]KPA74434.1 hypothetical protein ABB37_09126 [Leptomonas pyrrhocoris]|eukprot:XP_015652873.1 hypothetical protein ABB37_09126 [Leptomonas pyrrhocoris]